MSLFEELKRRNVVKVGIAYIVAAWLLLQLTEVLTELLELNTEVGKLVIVLIIIGFIPALIFAWAFEMTPEGIKREKDVDRSQSVTAQTGQKLNFAIIAMLVAIAGYFVWESRFSEREQTTKPKVSEQVVQIRDEAALSGGEQAASTDQRTSIVVLPFVNMSADADQEYFSDGLSEEILNALAQIADLRVISRTSAFAFKGKDIALPEIARQLDVSHVLEGSVRTAGDSVRITAQLIEVNTDSHLWSEAYTQKLENVFEIQEEISLAIADQLQLRLAPVENHGRPTTNVEAYKLFLRGRHHYQQRGAENLQQAEKLLEEALDLDPGFDLAWANLAAARLVSAFYMQEGFTEHFAKASDAAERAIELDPENGLAWATLGLLAMAEFEFETGLSHFDKAVELSPNESNTHLWKGIALLDLGYVQDAISTFKQAEFVDPAFTNLHNWLMNAYLAAGDYTTARYHHDQALALDPDFVFNNQGDLELHAGDFDQARVDILRSVPSEAMTPEREFALETFVAAMQYPEKVPAAIDALLAVKETDHSFAKMPLLFRLGAVDAAIEAWREQIAAGRYLRSFNQLSYFWLDYDRQYLDHPAIVELFEDHGLADFWRKNGPPDYCRAQGASFMCGEQ